MGVGLGCEDKGKGDIKTCFSVGKRYTFNISRARVTRAGNASVFSYSLLLVSTIFDSILTGL